jgi:hypothetical protein
VRPPAQDCGRGRRSQFGCAGPPHSMALGGVEFWL